MGKYVEQAKDFLKKCNAGMEIKYVGRNVNKNWGDRVKRDMYRFTITTPRGVMTDVFWSSKRDTQFHISPNEYNILVCLEKADPGTIDDFFEEYGYKVCKWADVRRIEGIYNAVVQQYRALCQIFTPEQMDMLREIN